MKTLEFDLSEKNVRPLGRCLVKGGKIICDNVGTGFECRFSGNAIRVYPALDSADASPVYFTVTIDETSFKISLASREQTVVCDGLADGEHCFRIVRITEIRDIGGSLVGGTAFEKADIMGDSPEILPVPAKKSRKIAFFGDSITNGWGVTNDGERDAFVIYEQDHTKTYAYLTAQHFDADESVLALSGHGVVADYGGNRANPMKSFYPYLSRRKEEPYDISAEENRPDLVVIALGTNDLHGGTSEKEFADAMRELISLVRADLPETDIIWFYGMMGNHFYTVIKDTTESLRETDKHVYCLESGQIDRNKGEIGAGWHPSAVGQARIASELEDFIHKTLNW